MSRFNWRNFALPSHPATILAATILCSIIPPQAQAARDTTNQQSRQPGQSEAAASTTRAKPTEKLIQFAANKKRKRPTAARKLFGAKKKAADMPAQSYGWYAKGCLAGGERLAPTGPAWQAMRLSRNRNWAHPEMVGLIRKLARDSKKYDGWNGLMVGDLTQPRGGPMLSGHASHQVGLDADIWLREMPDKVLPIKTRESFQPISMLKNSLSVDPKKFTKRHMALIRRAASFPQVQRIGVNHAIKRAMCHMLAKNDRAWLSKIRAWRGHHYHMHIRIKCPAGSISCRSQKAPGTGDGCAYLEKWHRNLKAYLARPKKKKKKVVKKKKKKPAKRRREITLAGLPKACRQVLGAQPKFIVPPLPSRLTNPAGLAKPEGPATTTSNPGLDAARAIMRK